MAELARALEGEPLGGYSRACARAGEHPPGSGQARAATVGGSRAPGPDGVGRCAGRRRPDESRLVGAGFESGARVRVDQVDAFVADESTERRDSLVVLDCTPQSVYAGCRSARGLAGGSQCDGTLGRRSRRSSRSSRRCASGRQAARTGPGPRRPCAHRSTRALGGRERAARVIGLDRVDLCSSSAASSVKVAPEEVVALGDGAPARGTGGRRRRAARRTGPWSRRAHVRGSRGDMGVVLQSIRRPRTSNRLGRDWVAVSFMAAAIAAESSSRVALRLRLSASVNKPRAVNPLRQRVVELFDDLLAGGGVAVQLEQEVAQVACRRGGRAPRPARRPSRRRRAPVGRRRSAQR